MGDSNKEPHEMKNYNRKISKTFIEDIEKNKN